MPNTTVERVVPHPRSAQILAAEFARGMSVSFVGKTCPCELHCHNAALPLSKSRYTLKSKLLSFTFHEHNYQQSRRRIS